MKVLHVGDISFVGSTLCRQLRKEHIQAEVLSKKGGPLRDLTDPWIRYRKNFIDEFNLCGVDPESYDIIHAHYLINWGSWGLAVRKPLTSILLHAHGADLHPTTPFHYSVQRAVARLSKFMCYSTPDLLPHLKWYKGRTIYLPNPIEIPYPVVEPAQRHFDRILLYGTLYRFKQIENLFPILEKLPYTVDIIDYGPDRAYFRKKAPKNVWFIPPFGKSEVNRQLMKYQLILGGSQDGSIRMCELEAMALGIPTLFPFKYNDIYAESLPMPEDWQNNIGQFFADRFLGERQRQWVELYHNVEVITEQLKKIYQRLKSRG